MKPDQNFNPDTNPFEAIVNAGKAPAAPQGGQGPTPQQMQQGGVMGKPMVKTPPNQMDYGAVGGTTPALTSALQAMQKFLAESQDATEIALGRSIIALISKLIDADQQKQMGQLPKS